MVVTDVIWGSRFRIHHRVADTYRAGRLLLAGDAAHVHSPAGGQGMNLGIQDAVALADALARVLAGEPDSVLDDYSAARRPIALDVVKMTDRLTRLATLPRCRASDPQYRYRAGRTDTCRLAALWPCGSADWFTADESAAAAQESQMPLALKHCAGRLRSEIRRLASSKFVGGDSWRMGPEGTRRVVTTPPHHGTARKQVVVYSCFAHLVCLPSQLPRKRRPRSGKRACSPGMPGASASVSVSGSRSSE